MVTDKRLNDWTINSIRHGPSQVYVDKMGLCVEPVKAKEEYDIRPDFILFRDDGWSLGAPTSLVDYAFKLFQNRWVGFVVRPETVARRMLDFPKALALYSIDANLKL